MIAGRGLIFEFSEMRTPMFSLANQFTFFFFVSFAANTFENVRTPKVHAGWLCNHTVSYECFKTTTICLLRGQNLDQKNGLKFNFLWASSRLQEGCTSPCGTPENTTGFSWAADVEVFVHLCWPQQKIKHGQKLAKTSIRIA